jgi:hypothetical protein
MPRGGKRPGAGRPRKDRGKQEFFEDAESYLVAVVQGLTPADAVRVQAAKTLIAYQKTKRRAKAKSPSPIVLERKEMADIENAVVTDFKKKAAEIRARHAKRGPVK